MKTKYQFHRTFVQYNNKDQQKSINTEMGPLVLSTLQMQIIFVYLTIIYQIIILPQVILIVIMSPALSPTFQHVVNPCIRIVSTNVTFS